MTETPPLPGPIAYLTGEYPRATDTFIQREIAGLRALGATVHTCTVRATDPKHHVGPEQRAEYAATFQVIPAAKNPLRLLRAHGGLLARAPGRWLSTLSLAARMCPPGAKSFLWQVFYFLEAGVLAAHLRDKGVVHLHNHFGNSSCSVAVLAAEMAGVPYSYTAHGPMEFFAPEHWRIDLKVARAAFVAAISHFARAQCMIFADQAHWDRIKIVHCAVEPERYAKAPPPSGKALLFVGRLSAIKGVALLLRAVAALAETHPDLTLTLVGDGPEAPGLKAEAEALGIADRVTFTGYLSQDEVAERLAATDVFVLPSFAEGVPVVLMEAMAAGRPVIAPQVAGVPELVEHGVSGFLVPPGDLKRLTGSIDALIRRPEVCVDMGEEGRRRVRAAFSTMSEAAWLNTLLAGSLTGNLPEALRPNDP
ncbi:MAG: glycosyltransferase [Pseudomonadota bacterium]